jgi:hypothetical protein
MIVLLSGTSGSGKTYIVEQLIRDLGPHDETFTIGPKAQQGGYIWRTRGVTIMGEYTSACGGCDRISYKGGSDDIERIVFEQRALDRKVVLEGLLVATWGVARLTRLVWGGLVLIQLTTPVEDCIKAVIKRREQRAREAGREPTPLDPTNTATKYRGLRTVLQRRRAAGIPVEELDRAAALKRVRELILG